MATSDDLWGGQLTAIQFDPVRHTCELDITTVLDRRSHSYVINTQGVTDFRFRNAIPEPWEYAEVTEVHIHVDGRSGQHVLEFLLWSEDAELVLHCSSVDIREVPL